MTQEKKIQFINIFFDNMRNAAVKKTQYMPEDWDAMEIRQYLAAMFAEETYLDKAKHYRKRFREFKNTCNVEFGL